MAISFVQHNQALSNVGVASQDVIWASNTTTGNMIIVTVGTATTGNNFITSITDSQSNTYTKLLAMDGWSYPASLNGRSLEIWYAKNITGGVTPTVTATFSASAYRPNMTVQEYSGLDIVQPVDLIISRITSATTAPGMTSPLATATANELIFNVVENLTNAVGSAGSGYSNYQTQGASTTGQSSVQDKVVSAIEKPTATMTTGNSINIFAIITFTDTQIGAIRRNIGTRLNNYQAFNADSGISVTEKIR